MGAVRETEGRSSIGAVFWGVFPKDHPIRPCHITRMGPRSPSLFITRITPKKVRVVSIGNSYDDLIDDLKENRDNMEYSVEFCGGTHLQRSGEAELFRIIEETAVAKGIRRITAVTGERAKKCNENAKALLEEFERVSDSPAAELAERMTTLRGRVNEDDLPFLERLKLRDKLAELHTRVKQHAKKQAYMKITVERLEHVDLVWDDQFIDVIGAEFDEWDGLTINDVGQDCETKGIMRTQYVIVAKRRRVAVGAVRNSE